MKKYYLRFRAFLMAFAIGLAGFWFTGGLENGLVEPNVELPVTISGDVLLVLPRYGCEIPFGGGSCGTFDDRKSQDIFDNCVFEIESQGITFKKIN